MSGGRRSGAGRPKGSMNSFRRDIAAAILEKSDQKELWDRLLHDENPKIRLEALRYLTDRAHGKAREASTLTVPSGGKASTQEEDVQLIKNSLRAVLVSGGEAARIAAATAMLKLYGADDDRGGEDVAALLREFALSHEANP